MRTVPTAAVLVACLGYAASAQAIPSCVGVFSATGVTTTCSVPASDVYDITALGAQGGGNLGGLGAKIGGEVSLAAGTLLTILAGGEGGQPLLGPGGGGGGSFVVDGMGSGSAMPLVIAGGGGGGGVNLPGGPGLVTPFGANGGFGGGSGGTSGSGGGSSDIDGGGGGGGYSGGGGNASPGFSGRGGESFLAGGLGGAGYAGTGNNFGYGAGGFGGGGSGGGLGFVYGGGGGGGGYSGSLVVGGGGGGGSYLDPSVTGLVVVLGETAGEGSVTISLASTTPVPEPPTLSLLAAGLFGAAFVHRHRMHSASDAPAGATPCDLPTTVSRRPYPAPSRSA